MLNLDLNRHQLIPILQTMNHQTPVVRERIQWPKNEVKSVQKRMGSHLPPLDGHQGQILRFLLPFVAVMLRFVGKGLT